MAMCPFSLGFVFRVVIFSPDLLSSLMKLCWENFFFSPVSTIMDWGLLTLFISLMVFMGFGMFCRRVTAKTWSKALFWRGV